VVNAKPREIAIVRMDDGGLAGDCEASTGNTPGCRLPADPGLREQGWEWRCNADALKVDQIVESYRELGFEIRLEPINLNGLAASCGGCKPALAQSTAVYVRAKGRP
jgi:hypothetical protein